MLTNNSDTSILLSMLEHFHPQSEEIRLFFQQEIRLFSFKRGELLQRAGDYCEYIYFVKKGVVRGFLMEEGRDITTWLTAENELVTSISSLDRALPSFENIEAVLDCELFGMHIEKMDELYNRYPEFNITSRKLIQKYYRDAEMRAYQIRLSNAEQKYLHFMEYYPHLANRIPLRHVASFLNITLETLSRVRKRISF